MNELKISLREVKEAALECQTSLEEAVKCSKKFDIVIDLLTQWLEENDSKGPTTPPGLSKLPTDLSIEIYGILSSPIDVMSVNLIVHPNRNIPCVSAPRSRVPSTAKKKVPPPWPILR